MEILRGRDTELPLIRAVRRFPGSKKTVYADSELTRLGLEDRGGKPKIPVVLFHNEEPQFWFDCVTSAATQLGISLTALARAVREGRPCKGLVVRAANQHRGF
jgi:hypothetical protein